MPKLAKFLRKIRQRASIESTSEHEREIKAILEVYGTILWAYTDYNLLNTVSHITAQPHAQPPLYTLHKDPIKTWSAGASSLPPDTPPEQQRACLISNLCDFGLEITLRPISAQLQKLGARADWLLVSAAPRMLLHFDDKDPEICRHSVLAVTSKGGEQYIADFTVEQFGYPEEYWFMKKADYMEQCTRDGHWRLAGDDDLKAADQGAEDELEGDISTRLDNKVRETCRGLDWEKLEKLGRVERIEVVQRTARECFASIV